MEYRLPLLDQSLGPIGNFVTCISGPAGGGKTTLALQAAAACLQQGRQVVFLDCQSGLSLERLQQMVNDKGLLKRFLVKKIYNFKEQDAMIGKLPEIIDDFGLVIVDSMGAFFRATAMDEYYRKQLEMQMRILVEMSRIVPVIVTNQVYEDIKQKKQRMIAEDVIGFWAEKNIFLHTKPNRMVIEDSQGKKDLPYRIESSGITLDSSSSSKILF